MKLTLNDAKDKAARGKPWTFRLEFVGANPTNASGVSAKYWYATGRGLNEGVQTGHGAIGSAPAHNLLTWKELEDKVNEKLGKGYVYADTVFIRMTPDAIAKLTGTPIPAAPQAKAVSSLTQAVRVAPQVPKALVVKAGTTLAPGVKVLSITPTPMPVGSPVHPDLLKLPQPYCLIRALRILRKGLTITGYSALDDKGHELLQIDPTEAVDFARDYGIDILFS